MNKIERLERDIAEAKRLRKLAEGGRRFAEADEYYRQIVRIEAELEEARKE